MSWANVTRVIVQNLQNLGSTIGQITINAFKPFLIAVNNAILKLNDFAIMIANSLGKIFGWTYEQSGGAMSDMADGAEDLADGLDDASGKAKKLKNNLLGIDELNIISQDDGSGSGSGSGASSGGASVDDSGWKKTDSMLKGYESSLDTLYKLGDAISERLIKAMESIKWNDIYEKARGFGSGLASFLNGLFADQNGITLFGEVGKTIASALNTVIYTSLSFTDTFDFEQFGKNIADGINRFFKTFDWKSCAEGINGWVDGLEKTLSTAIKEINWGDVFGGIMDFFMNLDLDTFLVFMGIGAIRKLGKKGGEGIGTILVSKIGKGILKKFTTSNLGIVLADIGYRLRYAIGNALAGSGATVSSIAGGFALTFVIGFKFAKKYLESDFFKMNEKELGSQQATTFTSGGAIGNLDFQIMQTFFNNTKKSNDEVKDLTENTNKLKVANTQAYNPAVAQGKMWQDWFDNMKNGISSFGDRSKTVFEGLQSNAERSFGGTQHAYESMKRNLKDIVLKVSSKFQTTKENVEQWYANVRNWWGDRKLGISNWFSTTYNDVQSWWSNIVSWWGSKSLSLSVTLGDSIKGVMNKLIDSLNNVIRAWNGKKSLSAIHKFAELPRFENGGYPASGSLFWAGENRKPELMGTIGGRTAVASGNEITGIANAVYSTSSEEVALLRQQNQLLTQLLAKEPVLFGDREIARANQRGQRAIGMTLRTT